MSKYEPSPVKQRKRAMRTKVMLTAFYLQTFIISEALSVEYLLLYPVEFLTDIFWPNYS